MRKDKSRKSKKVVTIPEIKIKKTSVQKIKNLKKNEKDNQELIQKTLNDLKNNEAEISKETLSHYGKGMTQSKGNDQSSIRIFNYKDTYRLKFSYDSNLNLEKFI